MALKEEYATLKAKLLQSELEHAQLVAEVNLPSSFFWLRALNLCMCCLLACEYLLVVYWATESAASTFGSAVVTAFSPAFR